MARGIAWGWKLATDRRSRPGLRRGALLRTARYGEPDRVEVVGEREVGALWRRGPCPARPWHTAYGMLVSALVSGYAGFSTGFAGSPPFFSQRSSLAMASEKEWATVA